MRKKKKRLSSSDIAAAIERLNVYANKLIRTGNYLDESHEYERMRDVYAASYIVKASIPVVVEMLKGLDKKNKSIRVTPKHARALVKTILKEPLKDPWT